jgi:hypothetical protein
MLNTSSSRKDIKDLLPSDAVKVYSGKAVHCACGCSGKYFEPGSKMVARVLNKIKAANPATVDIGSNYVAIENETRTWVFYTA